MILAIKASNAQDLGLNGQTKKTFALQIFKKINNF